VTLPVLGDTTTEDAVFYVVAGGFALLGMISWPTAGLFSSLHAIHQRARNVTRSGAVGEARAGLIELAEDFA
jgi:hypothetical protein